MSRRSLTRFLAGAILIASPLSISATLAADKACTATGNELAALMTTTQLNAVMDYAGAPADYKPSDGADVLDIVFMPKSKDVKSHVTDDGRVIFLVGKVSDSEQQRLITLAFCIRVNARKS